MADQCTMPQLLQAPTEGYEDAIVVPAFTADNFELKHGLLTLIQNKQFFRHDKEDPHAHVRYFNKITSTLKFLSVSNTSIKLMLFLFSLMGAAWIWLEKEPPRSIFTWDDLVSKFINQFFPPSKTTNLRNEITNFQQRFDESFSEAWDRFKDLLRACPHHGFSKSHQLDTFDNALNSKDQDSLNSALVFVNSNSASTSSSGTLPSNTITNIRSDLKAITTRSDVSYDGPYIPPPPSFLPKVVENEQEATKDTVIPTNNGSTEDVQPRVVKCESLVLTSEPVTSPISKPAITLDSAPKPNPKSSIPYPSKRNDERNREKANNQIEKFYQIFKDMKKLSEMARTSLNEHYSVVLLKKLPKKLGDPGKFLIPCDFPELADCLITRPVRVVEDVYVKVGSFHFLADFVVVDFDADPRVPLILGRSFLKTERALIDVFKGELTFRIGKKVITFNLGQTSRYSANYSDRTAKRINVIDMACEEYSQEVLGFFDTISSGNPTPYCDPIVSTTSSTLTSFENNDFLLEEVDAFLALEDDPASPKFYQSYLDPEGDILLLEAFLNDDPSLPLPNQGNYFPEVRKELKICEAKSDKSSVDESPAVELKDLPPHLEYAFLEGDDKLPVIIAKDLSTEEKTALITVLKFHNPVHCVPKKGGFTVVENEDNELIPNRLVMGWRVCIDYRKLNEATRKDHFPQPFMDQMLERLAGNQYYYFLVSFSGYFQIPIDPKDQEKTTFTCPYGTFACRRMPFGLCNAPGTFQRCMMAIFHGIIEKTMEVFMDDFSVFGNSCQICLSHLERMMRRKLTEAPILIAPNWDMPFELMCDASDYAIGAVLGQCQDKHFRPIHYATKTMTEAESNYTTTEKEMLAVVSAFEKF
nr:hypothetical protein [Tanacetum cinerariifolium]